MWSGDSESQARAVGTWSPAAGGRSPAPLNQLRAPTGRRARPLDVEGARLMVGPGGGPRCLRNELEAGGLEGSMSSKGSMSSNHEQSSTSWSPRGTGLSRVGRVASKSPTTRLPSVSSVLTRSSSNCGRTPASERPRDRRQWHRPTRLTVQIVGVPPRSPFAAQDPRGLRGPSERACGTLVPRRSSEPAGSTAPGPSSRMSAHGQLLATRMEHAAPRRAGRSSLAHPGRREVPRHSRVNGQALGEVWRHPPQPPGTTWRGGRDDPPIRS